MLVGFGVECLFKCVFVALGVCVFGTWLIWNCLEFVC